MRRALLLALAVLALPVQALELRSTQPAAPLRHLVGFSQRAAPWTRWPLASATKFGSVALSAVQF